MKYQYLLHLIWIPLLNIDTDELRTTLKKDKEAHGGVAKARLREREERKR
jgi:hypothetical protein